jgi:hypothetical protein
VGDPADAPFYRLVVEQDPFHLVTHRDRVVRAGFNAGSAFDAILRPRNHDLAIQIFKYLVGARIDTLLALLAPVLGNIRPHVLV